MATPVKSVQFRDADSIVAMYKSMQIPAFGVKQGSSLNWKYPRNDSVQPNIEDGAAELQGFLDLITDNQSAAIYTLCLYEEPGTRITDKTPVDLSWGFRLRDQVVGNVPGEMWGGGYGQLLGELRIMKKELEDLKKKPADADNKLGLIGEIMEMEAVQPIMLAIGNVIADGVMKFAKVGELKRVSGIPGHQDEPAPAAIAWQDDPRVVDALNRLSVKVPDVGGTLQKLAQLAERNAPLFQMYLKMITGK
jgi:hypothetical protein